MRKIEIRRENLPYCAVTEGKWIEVKNRLGKTIKTAEKNKEIISEIKSLSVNTVRQNIDYFYNDSMSEEEKTKRAIAADSIF